MQYLAHLKLDDMLGLYKINILLVIELIKDGRCSKKNLRNKFGTYGFFLVVCHLHQVRMTKRTLSIKDGIVQMNVLWIVLVVRLKWSLCINAAVPPFRYTVLTKKTIILKFKSCLSAIYACQHWFLYFIKTIASIDVISLIIVFCWIAQ